MTAFGRSPDGSGSRPSDRAADGVSPVPASIPDAMSDKALAHAIAPGDPDRMKYVKALTPERRAALEHMIWVAKEVNAGRIPPGVLI